jgi:hypothetical protein
VRETEKDKRQSPKLCPRALTQPFWQLKVGVSKRPEHRPAEFARASSRKVISFLTRLLLLRLCHRSR